nr:coat protein [Miscanthus cryptic virus]
MHPDSGATDDSTHPKRPPSPVAEGPLGKKFEARSNERRAADYLCENNRIGSYNHYPLKKRRYVHIKLQNMLNGLEFIYLQFFKAYWHEFSRVFERNFSAKTAVSRLQAHATRIYLTHWVLDCYVSIRFCLRQLDPVAYNEKYHYDLAPYSGEYDHFLATLCNCLRPVHTQYTTADVLYIPVLEKDQDFSNVPHFKWENKYEVDHSLFTATIQIIKQKNLLKMSPISSDVMGRPFWLFDWPTNNEAYSWFPEEGNYNATDVTMAYIIGTSVTPKLGFAFKDEWKIQNTPNPMPTSIPYDGYQRIHRPIRHGTSEYHYVEMETIVLPNYYPTGTGANASMTGPLALPQAASTSAAAATTEDRLPDDEEAPSSPEPPAPETSTDGVKSALRTRAVDCVYHTQVIQRPDSATRFTAWKIFTKP